MKTMSEVYGEEDDYWGRHPVCEECGMCSVCSDCNCSPSTRKVTK